MRICIDFVCSDDKKRLHLAFFSSILSEISYHLYIFIINQKFPVMKKVNVERALKLFMERPEFKAECKFLQNQSEDIYRQLLEADNIPDKEIVKRFENVKPLLRLRKRNMKYGTSLNPECMDNRCKVIGGDKPDDLLVWAITGNLNENFIREFGQSTVLRYGNSLLSVGKLEILTRFTIYTSSYRGCGDLLPKVSTADVLRQLPQRTSPDEQYAFELKGVADYDKVLQRVPVQVMLYRVVDGYTPRIAEIKAVCRPAVADIF